MKSTKRDTTIIKSMRVIQEKKAVKNPAMFKMF